ncbi:RNA-dependent RNA polymerase [Botryotinia fuckeliana totivirus 1]|uniref:RNA-dependent RNA polymerase n=1 Tax=Botryotinia fuckeliana totivirus 1 TaxID=425009 RepID=UPI0000F5850A|nr:RNA-dependent RNA polymerase [Botryotinia fuckeliana totivirus 1]CAM33265.1 RNA-dependent RNA polymerase [Botryotinia fuckeliana totivirus 1]
MSAADRASAYGRLGSYLKELLDDHPFVQGLFSTTNFTQSLIRLQGSSFTMRSAHPLLPHAASLLLLDFPMQTDTSVSDVISLARNAYDLSDLGEDVLINHTLLPPGSPILSWRRRGYHRKLGNAIITNKELRDSLFPKKKHNAAGVKVNLTIGRLAVAWARVFGPGSLGRHLAAIAGRVTNDQACSALLYCLTLREHIGSFGISIAQAAVTQPANAKGLSNALKALGANSSLPGSLLVEAATLQGRFTNDVDMTNEIRSRTIQSLVDEQVIDRPEELRPHIKALLEMSLPGDCALPDMDEWWSSRWLWCVNGSETKKSDEALGLRGGSGRRYRRMAAEEVHSNPVPDWDGTTSVSASIKLEAGKDRAIFACDTRSYFAFSWILNDVQKKWKGERIPLDPGKGGLYGISRRIRNSQRGGGVNLMLDYDNFNSHHSNSVQSMIFEVLCDKYNAPQWYKEVLMESFNRMYIFKGGVRHRMLGTLASGHRGTSFINSLLNAAYIRCALGAAKFDTMLSLHAGDDVYIRANTLSEAADILKKCKMFGCRMNPTKQSIGFRNAEFLRLGINSRYAVGYVARTISTLVAGNWSNLDPMEPLESLTSVISSVRSVINRGAPTIIADVIAYAHSTLHPYPLKILKPLLRGEAAIAGAPIFNLHGKMRTYEAVVSKPDNSGNPPPPEWGSHATLSYLEYHVAPIEASAISRARVDLTSIMQESSYAKQVRSDLDDASRRTTVKLIPRTPEEARGYIDASTLSTRDAKRGILESYPLIRLLENRLSDEDLRELALLLGVSCSTKEARVCCFGSESLTHNIIGYLPYSDAASMSKTTNSRNIYTTYHVRA